MSDAEKAIVEPTVSDSPSVKERASQLWNSLRTTVSTTTREVKDTLYKASDEMSTYSKPICLQGKHCSQASDREHMRLFRHLCPYGLQCTSQGFTTHYNDFVHSSVMAEEAFIVDPNDNRSKATTSSSSSSSNNNNNVSGSSGGILDFLDDSKNETVKSLKHMINFPSTSTTAAFSSGTVGLCLNSSYQRNAPITSLTPIRVCYGMQMWKIYIYHQTAQWPQFNEVLTHEEEIFIRDFNKQHQTRTNDFKNDIIDDRYVGISSDDNNNKKHEKSVADKAKDFFDELFGEVRDKNNNSSNHNNQNDDDEASANNEAQNNKNNENKNHKSDFHDNEDESAGIVSHSHDNNNKAAENKRAETKSFSGDSSYQHQRLPDEEDDVRLLGHDGEDTSAM